MGKGECRPIAIDKKLIDQRHRITRCPDRPRALPCAQVRAPVFHLRDPRRSAKEGAGGRFVFAAATCQACPLRSQCVLGKGPRTISIQAEEGLQQQARAHNQTEAGRKSLRERVVVEHRIARLVRRQPEFGDGIRPATGGASGRPPRTDRRYPPKWPSERPFRRLESTLRWFRASLGVTGRGRATRRHSRHAILRLKDPGSRTDL